MASLKPIDQTGRDADEVTLNDNVFGIEPNENVVFDAVIKQRAGMHQGTHATRNRSSVRGNGKKPWGQKDTGRARQGSIGAPQWRGGGAVFGPTPRSHAYNLSRKIRHLAIRSVLSQRLQNNNLIVLDRLSLDVPKTKEFKAVLGNLSVDSKILVVSDNENVQLSARNLENVGVIPVSGLNVIGTVNYDRLILTQDVVKRIEEVLT